ncbi:MAG: hypothetical protein PF572_03360 [Patescibacteria group bacterium]|jgi:cell division protein FtsB|nr:hypothetical protein [Patescibacteria group bacterium]
MDGVRANPKKSKMDTSVRRSNLDQAKKIIKKSNNINKSKKENMLKGNSVLTNLLSIAVTALIVGGAIYAWQDKAKDDSLSKVQLDAKNVREGYERSLKNLENEKRKVASENDNLKTENDELKTTVDSVKGAVKNYSNEELGISFSYPALFESVNYEKSAGESGEKFSIKFSKNDNFHIAGVSAGYKGLEVSTSTEANFDNFIKIEKDKDEYMYYVSVQGEEVEYKLNPIEVIPFSGGEALLVDSKSFILEEEQLAVGIGQNLGAVLNTNKEGFSGMAMINSDFGQLSPDDFKAFLESIELK